MSDERRTAPPTVVLIVDDDGELRTLARAWLEAAGAEVHEGASPEAALAESDAHRPDVVVLDHELHAELSGLELAPLLARRHPGTKVLMFSVSLDQDDAHFPGVSAVLNKLDAGRLVEVVLAL